MPQLPLPTGPVTGAAAMHAAGRALAPALGPGDVLCLRGDLGAGKTTLVKGLADGLGLDPEAVASPTFALVHHYDAGELPVVHLDLYRIHSAAELQAAGLVDALHDAEALVIVEWPDVAAGLMPREARWLTLAVVDGPEGPARQIRPFDPRDLAR